MKVINDCCKNIILFFVRIINSIYYLPQTPIVVNAWIKQAGHIIVHRNFGDELNIYLIEALTGRKTVTYKMVFKSFVKTNFLCIGSMFHYMDSCSVIWGAGTIFKWIKYKSPPKRICAVRGPLTRDTLIRQGIECPEIYGDPALLLPLVYNQEQKKKYRVGLIPHIYETDDFRQNKRVIPEGVHLICMDKYIDWHHKIDEIRQCEVIASSSLHGLIIADAYGIPNVWIKLSDKIEGGSFKYIDYMGGVKKNCTAPIDYVNKELNVNEIEHNANMYVPITFNPYTLLEVCPFDLLKQYRKE